MTIAKPADPGVYADEPSVLVFADDAQRGAAEAAVRGAGGRIVSTVPIVEAAARLDLQAGIAVVVVEAGADAGPAFDALLDRLDRAARERRHGVVVTVPVPLIDAAAARITHPDVVLLADPEPAQRAAAVAMACAARRLSLRDIGAEGGAARLIELGEEVGRIARMLAALTGGEGRGGNGGAAEGRDTFRARQSETAEIDAATLRGIIRTRRLRDQHFPADLFADPAWDMLLDLMAARIEGRGVAVSSLCIAAAVPPTTALRWIRTMTDSGFFVRRADPIDGRRVFIELAEPAASAMTAYLAAARAICQVQA